MYYVPESCAPVDEPSHGSVDAEVEVDHNGQGDHDVDDRVHPIRVALKRRDIKKEF